MAPVAQTITGTYTHQPAMPTSTTHPQEVAHRQSLEDPESFWGRQADLLHWHRKPSAVLRRTQKTLKQSGVSHASWSWFPDGEISTCFNCVDRHVLAGRGDEPAIIWDSPVTNSKETLTYARLLDEVEVLAGALREEGVGKGDVVLVYSEISPWPAPSPSR